MRSIKHDGKLLTLEYGARCSVCQGELPRGSSAVWWPSGQIAHLRVDCPARVEFGNHAIRVLPTADRRAMWRSAERTPVSQRR